MGSSPRLFTHPFSENRIPKNLSFKRRETISLTTPRQLILGLDPSTHILGATVAMISKHPANKMFSALRIGKKRLQTPNQARLPLARKKAFPHNTVTTPLHRGISSEIVSNDIKAIFLKMARFSV